MNTINMSSFYSFPAIEDDYLRDALREDRRFLAKLGVRLVKSPKTTEVVFFACRVPLFGVFHLLQRRISICYS